MFIIQLIGENFAYYSGNKSFSLTTDINKAVTYSSKKKVSEALKANKDEVKRLTRKYKSSLVTRLLLSDCPGQKDYVEIDVALLEYKVFEVSLVIINTLVM